MSRVERPVMEINGTEWTINARYRGPALEALLSDIEAVFAEGEVLVDRGVSTVVRTSLTVGDKTLPLIAKRKRVRRPKLWKLPHFLRRASVKESIPAQEWRGLCAAEERGLPVPSAVALGERRVLGRLLLDSYLITEAVPNAVNLSTFLSQRYAALCQPAGSRQRSDLARRLGELIGRMHRSGFTHGDLCSINILVTEEQEGAPDFVLIDLDGAGALPGVISFQRFQTADPNRLAAGLSQALGDLVKLDDTVGRRVKRTDCLRFLRAYFGEQAPDRSARRALVSVIEAKARERLLKAARKTLAHAREGKPWRGLMYDRRFGFHVYARKEYTERYLSQVAERVASRSRRGEEEPESTLETAPGDIVIQRFVDHGRRSRGLAMQAWQMLNVLYALDLPAVQPLFLLKRRLGLTRWESFLATLRPRGSRNLSEVIPDLRASTRGPLLAVIRSLARLVQTMHRFGVLHGNLTAGSLLVSESAEGAPRVLLSDAANTSFSSSLDPRAWWGELAQLSSSLGSLVTNTERLRFLRAYLSDDRELLAKWKETAGEIVKAGPERDPVRGSQKREG